MPADEWEAMCTPMHCIIPAAASSPSSSSSLQTKPPLVRAPTSPHFPPSPRSPTTPGTSYSPPSLARRQTSSGASLPPSPIAAQYQYHAQTTKTGALYLGSWVAAVDDALLAQNNIRAIVEVLDAPWASTPATPAPGGGFDFSEEQIYRYKVAIPDSSAEGVLKPALLDGAVRFIGERISKGQNVLVHCQQGISRSASIVTAYLMRTRSLSFDDALALVRAQRPCVKPNSGFQKALRAWASGAGTGTSTLQVPIASNTVSVGGSSSSGALRI
ncbi:phosphatases II [Schizopora paradoxa]|uniref:protein-tyrosine-phosphatase n=1 Tax=Schizopora paradoxa TaxID=27342 RepID=A0A0H2RE29_9AGAM|nr:phosphatases II [Schizopora paradoxa]